MCDTESSPNFTHTCTAEQRRATLGSGAANPKSPRYIGKSPGNAFMELQFYEPGWVPQFAGFGCSATQWCANLTIDSLSDQDNTGVPQNADCLDNHFLVGEEPINWAYITKSGKSQAPANPLALSDDPNVTGLNPDLSKDLLMNPGDTIRVHMHDTPAGYRVDITDLTTGQHGSMTASIANGFGQVLFEPKAKNCHVRAVRVPSDVLVGRRRAERRGARTPRTSASRTRSATSSTAMRSTRQRRVHQAPAGATATVDVDDQACLDGAQFGALIPIKGCVLDDGDFDGPSYQRDWPGTFAQRGRPTGRCIRHAGAVHGARRRAASRWRRSRSRTTCRAIERGEPGNVNPSVRRRDRRALLQPATRARSSIPSTR